MPKQETVYIPLTLASLTLVKAIKGYQKGEEISQVSGYSHIRHDRKMPV